jgi:hypothetical protein
MRLGGQIVGEIGATQNATLVLRILPGVIDSRLPKKEAISRSWLARPGSL